MPCGTIPQAIATLGAHFPAALFDIFALHFFLCSSRISRFNVPAVLHNRIGSFSVFHRKTSLLRSRRNDGLGGPISSSICCHVILSCDVWSWRVRAKVFRAGLIWPAPVVHNGTCWIGAKKSGAAKIVEHNLRFAFFSALLTAFCWSSAQLLFSVIHRKTFTALLPQWKRPHQSFSRFGASLFFPVFFSRIDTSSIIQGWVCYSPAFWYQAVLAVL